MQYVDSSLHKQQCIIGLAIVDHILIQYTFENLFICCMFTSSHEMGYEHTNRPYKLIECFWTVVG